VYWYLPMAWTMSFWDALMRPVEILAKPLDTDDLDAAAELHAEAFQQSWSGDEFASLLAQPGTFGFVARAEGPAPRAVGMVLARLAADEGEILTIAVSPAARGRGVGRLLMDNVLGRLHEARAASLFLEVEETNAPALRLYRRLRFEEVGRRPAYYAGADGRRTSALVLKRVLAGR